MVALLAWGVLAFGGVYPWAYWPLAGGAFLLGVWASIEWGAWHDWRVRRLALVLGAVAIAMVIQLVPVPYAWLAVLSPNADTVLGQYQVAWAARRPAWHALSIAPADTGVALALFVAFAALLVGLTRVVRYLSLDWLTTHLMGLGASLALLGIVQSLFLDPKDLLIYGFWRPTFDGTPFGPFVNRNHFAGWMIMALPLVIAKAWAAFETTPKPQRPGLASWMRWMAASRAGNFTLPMVVAVVMAAALALTGSRSGLGGFAVGIAVLSYFFVRRLPSRRTRLIVIAGLGALFLGVLGWVGADVIGRFQIASYEAQFRFAAWRDALTVIARFPVFGIGFGAYGMVMSVYQTGPRETIFFQAHNDYLQVAAEGGILVALPVVLTLAVIIIGIRRRFVFGDPDPVTHWVRIGSVAGLVAIAAQSVVEFSLQKPGNAVLFITLLALALHRPRGQKSSNAHRV